MGHPDLLVKFKGEATNTIVDLKTPLAKSKTWGPQCAAYRALAVEKLYPVTRNLALQLRPDGSSALATEYSGNLFYDMGIFNNALACWWYFNG